VRFVRTRGQRSSLRWSEIESREADRRALLKSNPRIVLENVLSRKSVSDQVARQLIANPEAGRAAAVKVIADRVGVPVDVVEECIAIEALETGQ